MFSLTLFAASALTTTVLSASAPPQVSAVIDDPVVEPQSFVMYRQPWTPPSAAFESRVRGCNEPAPTDVVAMDDFGLRRGGRLVGMRWWGVLFTGAQIGKPYYIAIYADADCRPADLLYRACVVPRVRAVGIDCRQQRVFEFRSAVPAFLIEPGKHYWLQISESDADSAQPGVNDFLWSGHQPVNACPALQTPNHIDYRTLIDPCNERASDLAFDLLIDVP